MSLNYAEASVDELKARAAELRSDLVEIPETERTDDQAMQFRSLLAEVDKLDTFMTLASAIEFRDSERARQDAARYLAPAAATGAIGEASGFRRIGDAIAADPAWDRVDALLRSTDPAAELSFDIEWRSDTNGGYGERSLLEYGTGGPGNNASTAINTLLPVGQPIAPTPRMGNLFMRQLIPSTPTTLSQIPYVRELNPTTYEGGATAVPEGFTKPDNSLAFQAAVAPVTVIAANISPSKQLWEDAPVVVAYINQELPYRVGFREDAEILNGSGTWPDLTGLKNAPGIQSQSAVSGQTAQTIGNAIAKVENVDGNATGVVMNPTDAWAMFTLRAASGAGTFDAGVPFAVGMFQTVWGLPVKRSRVYASGSALVGDYQRGAMIFDRQSVNVQIYPQHSTYAAQNLVLVQAESRLGLAVFRGDFFVNATIA